MNAMKDLGRVAYISLCLCLILTFLPGVCFATGEISLPGDITGDGALDAADAAALFAAVSDPSAEKDPSLMDVNGDNKVNNRDAILLFRKTAVKEPPAEAYTVTFDPNGGTVSPTSKTAASGQPVGTLPTPTRSHYIFDGWYTSPTGGTRITEAATVNDNVSFFARWVEIQTEGNVVYYAKSSSGMGITSLDQMERLTVCGNSFDIPISSTASEFIFFAAPSYKTLSIRCNFNGFTLGVANRGSIGAGYTLCRIGAATISHTGPLYYVTLFSDDVVYFGKSANRQIESVGELTGVSHVRDGSFEIPITQADQEYLYFAVPLTKTASFTQTSSGDTVELAGPDSTGLNVVNQVIPGYRLYRTKSNKTFSVSSGYLTAQISSQASDNIVYYAKASGGTAITQLAQMAPLSVSGNSFDVPVNALNSEFLFVAVPSNKTISIRNNINGFIETFTDRGSIGTGYTLYRTPSKGTSSHSGAIYSLTLNDNPSSQLDMIVYYAESSSGTGITDLSQMTSMSIGGNAFDIPVNSLSGNMVFVAVPSDKTLSARMNTDGTDVYFSERGSIGSGYTLYRSPRLGIDNIGPIFHVMLS